MAKWQDVTTDSFTATDMVTCQDVTTDSLLRQTLWLNARMLQLIVLLRQTHG